MTFIDDLLFKINRPKVIIIAGEGKAAAKNAISGVLQPYYKIGKDIFIVEYDVKKIDKMDFLVNNSSQPVFVMTNLGDVPKDKDVFSGPLEKIIDIKKTVQFLKQHALLAVNFDDETVKSLKNETKAKILTFGFSEGVDLKASDMVWAKETNFKINYGGSIVPVWISGAVAKEQIYAALAAIACGIAFGLNLVQISQTLKSLDFTE